MMEAVFDDKVAVVTGSAQGIGEAVVFALASRSAIVYGLDIQDAKNQKTMQQAAALSGKPCVALHCDIGSPEEINKVFDDIFKEQKTIDILINNAAVFTTMSFIRDTYEQAWQDYEYNMNVNARGTFLCTKKAAPVMAKHGGGQILNVNTNHVKRYLFSVSKDEHCYDASKYAQMALNESMACELKAYGIRVNAICPAATRTPMLENFFALEDLPLTAERLGKATRIPSLLEPEEVAEAVCGMLCWQDDAPVGKEYLVMFSKDCKRLAAGPVEVFAK